MRIKENDLAIGLVFQQFYGDRNINNVEYCIVRGIVDECQIIILSKKNNKVYYEMIDIANFKYLIMKNVIITL